MSSYHFPIILGQNKSERIVIIHLVDAQENYEEKRVVITTPDSASAPLFRISTKVKVVDRSGLTNKYDIVIGGETSNKGKIQKGKSCLQVKIGDEVVNPISKYGYYDFYYQKEKFDGIVEYTYQIFDENGKNNTFKGKLHIVRPHRDDTMLKLTADLGSDATQVSFVLHKRAVVDEPPTFIELVEGMKDSYSNSRNYPNRSQLQAESVFIQEEKVQKGDGSSYRNPYYYKTGNITFKNDGLINMDINDEDSFINYLSVSSSGKNAGYSDQTTWDIEGKYDCKLVNIKMLYSEIGNPNSPAVGAVNFCFKENKEGVPKRITERRENLLEVLRSIYSQIINVSLKKFDDVKCEYYSIMLLVPNIYIQQNIDILLMELNDLMNDSYAESINGKDDNKEGKTRKLFDFRIVSESDSAFIGLKEISTSTGGKSLIDDFLDRLNIKDNKKKDTFLIIDAGKGTTDYSIIRYSNGINGRSSNLVTSLDRGGIVGAGGAIDYVFSRILARQIYRHRADLGLNVNEADLVNEEVFVNDFMKMIECLVPMDQNVIMLIVEKLKISYQLNETTNKIEIAKMYRCFENGDAAKIISFLLKADPNKSFEKVSTTYTDEWESVAKCNLDLFDNDKEFAEKQDNQEVESICDTIANAIIIDQVFKGGDSALTNSIDFVIFTGRSFLFRPLKEAFRKAIKGKKGIYRENYSNDLLGEMAYRRDRNAVKKDNGKLEILGNLTIAENKDKSPIVDDKDMKPISVKYHDHNLGVNCNSNLCCINGLSASNEKQEIVNAERFWLGFKGVGQNNRKENYYYIGYVDSFSCSSNAGLNVNQMTPRYRSKDDLIKMTLFPVRYQRVKLFNVKTPAGASQSTNNLTTGTTLKEVDD